LNRSIFVETAESLLGGAVPAEYVGEEGEVTVVARQGVKGFEGEWNTYQTLSAAQKEVVDFEVLARASQFGGNWENSLSWGVSIHRHIVASGGHGKWTSLSGGEVGVGKPGGKSPGTKRSEEVEEVERLEKRPVVDLAAEKAAAATPSRQITRPSATARKGKPRPKPTGTKTGAGKGQPTAKPCAGKGKVGGGSGGQGKVNGETCFRDELTAPCETLVKTSLLSELSKNASGFELYIIMNYVLPNY
jgi:hypothetical protein